MCEWREPGRGVKGECRQEKRVRGKRLKRKVLGGKKEDNNGARRERERETRRGRKWGRRKDKVSRRGREGG